MENIAEVVARLNARVEELEDRVLVLEHRKEDLSPATIPVPSSSELLALHGSGMFSFGEAGGALPVLGKAVLGIAGAYLLRALVEAALLPELVVIALAMAYAGMWLVWAARVGGRTWFAGLVYAATSGLILAPMLWELTMRFKVLSPAVAALVLAAFALAALALTWKHNLATVFWVAYSAAIGTAVALMIATRDLVSFLFAILFICVASEFAEFRGHLLNARMLAAAASDIGAWILIFIYSGSESSRVEYPVINAATCVLLALMPFVPYAVSVAIRTIVRHLEINNFEIVQTIAAFSLAIWGVMNLWPGDHRLAIGAVCLLFSATLYAAVFVGFNDGTTPRNYRVYLTWSAALFLLGSYFSLAQNWLAACLGLAAIAAMWTGARYARIALVFHGAVYLAAAAFAAGIFDFAWHSLVGPEAATPAWIISAIFLAACLCYLVEAPAQDRWLRRLPQLVSAALAAAAGAALLVSMIAALMAHFSALNTGSLELMQTVATCSTALAMSYFGARKRRNELTWIAYSAVVFVAFKLLFEDLRRGYLVFIAASFVLYAATLILLPRLAASRQKREDANATESSQALKKPLVWHP